MDDGEQSGSLIVEVLLSLLDRVTALEEDRGLNKRSIHDEMIRLYQNETPSLSAIARRTGYSTKTVRSVLRSAGLMEPAEKKEAP